MEKRASVPLHRSLLQRNVFALFLTEEHGLNEDVQTAAHGVRPFYYKRHEKWGTGSEVPVPLFSCPSFQNLLLPQSKKMTPLGTNSGGAMY